MQCPAWPCSPGAILGYRKNGMPIRLIAGGSGEDEGTPAADPAVSPEAPAGPPVTGETPAAPPEPQPGQEPAAAAGDDPDHTARTIAAIREDFKAERAKRQAVEKKLADFEAANAQRETEQAERNKQLAIALGIAQDDVTPEQLAERAQQERDAAQLQARTAAEQQRAANIELAVLRSAYATGVNGNALLDSRSFVATVSGLDPASDDFATAVTEAIETAVAANPGYKAAATPAPPAAPITPAAAPAAPAAPVVTIPRSGGEFNSAPGGNRQWTLDDVNAASAAEVAKAADAGLLADLGWGNAKKAR
jgi:hypothetical protein